MKRLISIVVAAGIAMSVHEARAQALGTAFDYQGELRDAGSPAAPVDLRFRLYDAVAGGSQIGATLAAPGVTPQAGRFSVSLDFGPAAFTGTARFLEIDVKPAGSGAYVTLAPRQRVNPTPYALFAANVAPTAVPWSFSGANAVFTTGNVGAGTGVPTAKLHVSGADAGTGLSLNVNNNLYVRSAGSFVGVNRNTAVTANEFFGVQAPITGANFGGMYIRTDSATGKPFYGYANNGGGLVYHYMNGADNSWRLNMGGLDRLAVSSTGNLGIGTLTPATPLDVAVGDKRFQVRLDGGVVPSINLAGTGGNLGIMRLRNALEIHPNDAATSAGSLDVRNLLGNATFGVDGATGNVNVNGILNVDAGGVNAGTLTGSSVRFGVGSGEGLLSRRSAGANQFGLDLLTGFLPRLSITNGGNVGVNTQTPGATLDVNGTLRASGQGAFSAPGGTAPFTVASTTRVTNLNADLLDGLDSTAFLTGIPNPLQLSGTGSGLFGSSIIGGTNTSGAFTRIGVSGAVSGSSAVSGTSAGVQGSNENPGGAGVYGLTTGAAGTGVLGKANVSSGIGVQGTTNNSIGTGVVGIATHASGGDGVVGTSTAGTGVRATTVNGGTALYGERTSNGNKGWFGGANEGGWAESSVGDGFVAISRIANHSGIYAENSAASGNAWGGYFINNTPASETLYCHNNAGGAAFFADGEAKVRVLTILGGADVAEPFDVRASDGAGMPVIDAAPGLVVCVDPDHDGNLMVSGGAYDTKVAGVISGANGLSPGVVMKAQGNSHADGSHPIAMTGRVWCYVDATFGEVKRGDRLTTSPTPGHAMRVSDESRAPGAVIGKAMTPLAAGEKGLVLVLVNLQ